MSGSGSGAAGTPHPSSGDAGAAPGRGVELAILALGVVGALVVWAVYPSAGNYDTVLDLVWARELLHGTKPGFEAYAASTPHPLWLAVGVPVVGVLGDDGDRAMVLISALSLAVLAAGTARLGRIAGEAVAVPERREIAGRATAAITGLLLLSSFAFGLLAAKGYLDVPFLALVTWAAALVLRRPASPTAWRAPAVLLAFAGLLRPEAWLLAGLLWLWSTVPGRWGARGSERGDDDRPPTGRVVHLGLVVVAPLLWMAMDLVVTGDPLHSLNGTSALADELGRERGITRAPRILVSQLVDQSRPPVLVAGLAGLAVLLGTRRLGLRPADRRVQVVLGALLVAGVVTFLGAGVANLSLIPRYLSVPVVAVTVLAGLAVAGWVGLPVGAAPGSATGRAGAVRRAWAGVVVVGAVLGVGAYLTVKRDSVERLGSELRFLSDARADVRALVDRPAVRRGLRCGPVSLPTYRLVPEIALQLGWGGDRVLARSDPAAERLGVRRGGVAITVDARAAGGKWRRRYAQADGVPRSTEPAPPGFRAVARSGAFVASVRCP